MVVVVAVVVAVVPVVMVVAVVIVVVLVDWGRVHCPPTHRGTKITKLSISVF